MDVHAVPLKLIFYHGKSIQVIATSIHSLQFLSLAKTDVSSRCAEFLALLTSLKILDLNRCSVGDAIATAVRGMPALEALLLSFTEVRWKAS